MIDTHTETTLPDRLRAHAHRIVVGTVQGVHRLDGSAPRPHGHVTAIAPDGDDLLVLVDGRRVWRIDGTGAAPVATLDGASAGCLVAHRGDVWLGGERATLWRQRGTGFETVSTFASAPTSEDWHTPWGGAAATFSLASASDALYANVHVGGILRSDDGGHTWHATIDLADDVHQVCAHPDGRVWAATGARGLGLSDDRGRTWRHHVDGLHSTYLLAVAPTRDGVLVAASSGHAGRDSAVHRLDGERFVRCTDGLPDDLGGTVGTGHLAADGDVAVLAAPDDRIYVSADGGRSWDRVAIDLPRATSVAVLPD